MQSQGQHIATPANDSLRILLLTPRLWYPANTGGRIRSSRLFETLARWHEVTALCFQTPDEGGEELDRMRSGCSELELVPWRETRKFSSTFYAELGRNLFSRRPYTVAKYENAMMASRLAARLASGRYDLLICDFLQPGINCLTLGFRPKILFQHNIEAAIRDRQASCVANPLLRAFARRDAVKLRDYEGRIARSFDCCITVSEADCRAMTREYGVRKVAAIPIAVDTRYFVPQGERVEQPGELVFIGSMDWHPNQDAVTFFVRHILPRVRRQAPATFTIVGRNPPPFIQRLAETPGVVVTGTVPDVRPYLARAQLSVVPLRVGGGTRLKIFEAMAMGKAVVATPIGAEGLPVTDGTDVALADNADAFASTVSYLLRHHGERRSLAVAGRRLVCDGYTWEAAAQRFSEICTGIVHHHRGKHDRDRISGHRQRATDHPR
jgi:sugar transferase (PEP-CTERM/EpsH1 system associated)